MPGWRIGMLATNAEFVRWILKVKSNIDSGTFRPMQLAAATALHAGADWYAANNALYGRRRALVEQLMTVLGCTFDPQQTGLFLWGRIPDRYASVEEMTEPILHEARVFITPGHIFGSNGERYIRLSLCQPEERLQEALSRCRVGTDNVPERLATGGVSPLTACLRH
jgi:aspartate/methionine/tyrosine aminotransferase